LRQQAFVYFFTIETRQAHCLVLRTTSMARLRWPSR
jgi:hypothetical protein